MATHRQEWNGQAKLSCRAEWCLSHIHYKSGIFSYGVSRAIDVAVERRASSVMAIATTLVILTPVYIGAARRQNIC